MNAKRPLAIMMVLALALTLAATGPAVAQSDNVKCTNTATASATSGAGLAQASAVAVNEQSSVQAASNYNLQAGNVGGGNANTAGQNSFQFNGNAIQFSYQSNYQSSNQDQCET